MGLLCPLGACFLLWLSLADKEDGLRRVKCPKLGVCVRVGVGPQEQTLLLSVPFTGCTILDDHWLPQSLQPNVLFPGGRLCIAADQEGWAPEVREGREDRGCRYGEVSSGLLPALVHSLAV